jgi:hypothetical protein
MQKLENLGRGNSPTSEPEEAVFKHFEGERLSTEKALPASSCPSTLMIYSVLYPKTIPFLASPIPVQHPACWSAKDSTDVKNTWPSHFNG